MFEFVNVNSTSERERERAVSRKSHSIAPALKSHFHKIEGFISTDEKENKNNFCLVASSFISFLTVGFASFFFSLCLSFPLQFFHLVHCHFNLFWMSHVPLVRFFSMLNQQYYSSSSSSITFLLLCLATFRLPTLQIWKCWNVAGFCSACTMLSQMYPIWNWNCIYCLCHFNSALWRFPPRTGFITYFCD